MNPSKKIITIVGALVVLVGVLYFGSITKQGGNPSGKDTETATSTDSASNTTATVAVGGGQTAGTKTSTGSSQPKTSSIMVTPAGGEIWSKGKTHEIRWTKNAGYSGAIALVNATTKNIVGWIAPKLTAQQVAYNWDTVSIFSDRVNPLKSDIAPGSYRIRVTFDGPVAEIQSEPFTVIAGESEKFLTRKVEIKDLNLVPNFLTVNRGEHVVIINSDPNRKQTILMAGAVIAALDPNNSYVINTAGMPVGSYEIRLQSNNLAKLTIVVK